MKQLTNRSANFADISVETKLEALAMSYQFAGIPASRLQVVHEATGEISAGQFPGRGVLGLDPLQFRPVVVFTGFGPITAGSTAALEAA